MSAGTLALLVLLCTATSAAAQAATGNPHGDLPEGLACTDCHTTSAWTPLRSDMAFDHARYGGFVLDGRHEGVACAGCHDGLDFGPPQGSDEGCAGCHVDVHRGTITRPCEACHTTESFDQLDFGVVHPADFPLEGAHLQTSCESCHRDDLGGAFTPLDPECATCHMDDYVSTTLVDHQSLGFSTDCTECHTLIDFRDVVFDHVTISGGFELQGPHSAVECTSCHSGPDGSIPTAPSDPSDCVACHLADYQSEHAGSGYPTDCLACHNGQTWDDAQFDHAAVGGFQLVGRHAVIECTACHSGPDGEVPTAPSGPDDCVSCHLADYQDEHGGSGFPTDCAACHNQNGWEGATFDHTLTAGFELVPNHDQLPCLACHVGSTSETLFSPSGPMDCYACHQADYDGEHTGTNFPTDCTECHETTTWSGATFDHPFLIFSGPHAPVWNECADCHITPGDFGDFTCLTCHRQSDMDDKHKAYPTYSYDSPTCLGCHPTGRKP